MFRVVILLLAVVALALLGLRVLMVFGVGQPAPPHHDRAGLPLGPVTYRQVVAHAEARLYYPGSQLFSRFGAGEYHHPLSGDVDMAFAGAIMTSDATPAEIYLWYQLWLLKHGWQSVARGRVATWLSHESYARGARESFEVAMDDPHLLGLTLGKRLPAGRTIYEISYSIRPARRAH